MSSSDDKATAVPEMVQRCVGGNDAIWRKMTNLTAGRQGRGLKDLGCAAPHLRSIQLRERRCDSSEEMPVDDRHHHTTGIGPEDWRPAEANDKDEDEQANCHYIVKRRKLGLVNYVPPHELTNGDGENVLYVECVPGVQLPLSSSELEVLENAIDYTEVFHQARVQAELGVYIRHITGSPLELRRLRVAV